MNTDVFAEIEYEYKQGTVAETREDNGRAVQVSKAQAIGGDSVDPIRRKFYDMRALASDNPYMWSDARLFYKQAKFMENFTDDYNETAKFSMETPCLQRMGYEKLRTYFTWRTKARQGEYAKTDISYVYLYIYELLSHIGTESPAAALNALFDVWKNWREGSLIINEWLLSWLKDFHVYYELPHSFSDFVNKFNLHEHYPEMSYDNGTENSLVSLNAVSAYDISKSKFYTASTENEQLMKDCLHAVLSSVGSLCAEKGIKFKDLLIMTNPHPIKWTPFRRALFHPWQKQADRSVELPGGELYTCKDSEWFTYYAAPYAHRKDIAGYFIKKTESCVRTHVGFKTKITADVSVLSRADEVLRRYDIKMRDIEMAIETAVAEFFREKSRVVVNVDHNNLARIREEAHDTQDKLIVPEGEWKEAGSVLPVVKAVGKPVDLVVELEVEPTIEPEVETWDSENSPNSIWAEFATALTNTELNALAKALKGKDEFITYASTQNIMPEVLADSINEKAMDIIGDNVLDIDGVDVVFGEYRGDVELIKTHPTKGHI